MGGEFEAPGTDATAEIDLDDLGLDLDGLEETAVAGDIADEEDFGDLTATGKNLQMEHDDLDATGTAEVLEIDDALEATGTNEVVQLDDSLAETGRNLVLDEDDTDVGIDSSLLDATGQTQVLTEDMAVDTAGDVSAGLSDQDATLLASDYYDEDATLPDDAATMLASLDDDDDEGEFDFAKTEALPKEMFSPDMSTDETGNLPDLAATDMDLDLDDLTAALRVSEVGDTVNQIRDDATVEQPRFSRGVHGDDETASTQALAPEDMSGDLHDARTMTEVGTKLDLARAYVDMGDPAGARSILDEVLDEGDEAQRQQAQQLLDSLPT
jgi:pilus assembly protein FimV